MGADQSNRKRSQSTQKQQDTVIELLSWKVTGLELKFRLLETRFDNIKKELDNSRNFKKQLKVFFIVGLLLLATGILIGTQTRSLWDSSCPVTVDKASMPSVDIPKTVSEEPNYSSNSLRDNVEDTPQQIRDNLKESATPNNIEEDESEPTVTIFEFKTQSPKFCYFVFMMVVLLYFTMTGKTNWNNWIRHIYNIMSRMPSGDTSGAPDPTMPQTTGRPVDTTVPIPRNVETSSFISPMKFVFVLCIVAVVFAYLCGENEPNRQKETDKTKLTKQENLQQKIVSIIRTLSDADSKLKPVNRTLSSIFVMDNKNLKPQILLLLGTQNSRCTICCFLWKNINVLAEYYDEDAPTSGYIQASDMFSKDDNDAKRFIGSAIEQTLTVDKKHIVVLQDIDRFPISSLSLVHSFLDPDQSPYKDVIFFLTAVTDIDQNLDPMKLAEKHFDKQWAGYETEYRRALMGRFISVVGLVHHVPVNQDYGDVSEKRDATEVGGNCRDNCHCDN